MNKVMLSCMWFLLGNLQLKLFDILSLFARSFFSILWQINDQQNKSAIRSNVGF